MKAYTVQIDDTLAESLAAEAAERSTSVEALIASAAAERAFEFDAVLLEKHDAQVQAGLAAERNGQVLSGVDVDARLAARRTR
uniref:CopG domain protein DNA-binding domain protein n=1 Tax=Caulobacter sp. (strain K31) TaxID=366602 RepID=B0SXD2_CAUSK